MWLCGSQFTNTHANHAPDRLYPQCHVHLLLNRRHDGFGTVESHVPVSTLIPLLGQHVNKFDQVWRKLTVCTDHQPFDPPEALQSLLYRPQCIRLRALSVVLNVDVSRLCRRGLVDLESPESDRITAQRVPEADIAVHTAEAHRLDVHESLVADVKEIRD